MFYDGDTFGLGVMCRKQAEIGWLKRSQERERERERERLY